MRKNKTIVWICLATLGIIQSLGSALANSDLDNLLGVALGIASLPHFIILLVNLMGLLTGKPSCPCQTDSTLPLPFIRIVRPLYWSNGLLGLTFTSLALVYIYMHPQISERSLSLWICWASIAFNGIFFMGCLCCMPCRIVTAIILQKHFPSISESYVFPHPPISLSNPSKGESLDLHHQNRQNG